MTILNILSAARKLIENPQHWTQGALARNAEGNSCVPISREAVAWDSTGAILRVAFAAGESHIAKVRVDELLRVLDVESGMLRGSSGRPIAMLNDYQGHEGVLRLYDAVIARIQAEGEGCEIFDPPAEAVPA